MATFPVTPLPITVGIAPGSDPNAMGAMQFTDVTSDVRYKGAVQITTGRGDETSKVGAGGHQLTLGNVSGNYSTRNPLGAYFGRLRKGTPMQTKVRLVDDLFARTNSPGLGTEPTTGLTWSANAAYSSTGANGQCVLASSGTTAPCSIGQVLSDDLEIFKTTSISATPTGGAWVDGTMIRSTDSNNFHRVHTEFATSGVIAVKITRIDQGNSTDLLATTNTSVAYSPGTKINTRIQAVGPTIRIKVWLASGSEPAAWTASADSTYTTAHGNAVGLYQWRLATNAGSLTMSIYEYRCDSIRATTPVPQWSPRWNPAATDTTVPVVGAGPLRRLSQGASVVRSPMYRQITGYTDLVGYWPIEDGSTTTALTNVVAGGAPGTATDMQFGQTGPAGSASAATFSDTSDSSRISGTFMSASTSAGWQFSWATKLTTSPSALTQMIAWWTSNGDRWTVNLNTGVYNVHVIDGNGNVLLDSNVSNVGAGDPTQWIAFRMKASVSAGTVSAEFAWYAQGAAVAWGVTPTYSGSTVGALHNWTSTGNVSMQNGAICHVYGVTGLTDNLQSYSAERAFDGYAGELAANRVLRLAAQEGVPVIVMGDSAMTAPMGIQSSGTFLDLVRECEDAEQGLTVERGVAVGFLTNLFRCNMPVSMALDFSSGHIADPPEPTDDDLGLFNLIKLTRKGGSEAIAQKLTSIALSGTYSNELTVNVQTDDQLRDAAGWLLHMGTVDELRWPRITLQLHGTPSLIPSWCGVRIGSRITIANLPGQVGLVDLIVEGYTETLNLFSWDIELNCSPAKPWSVGIWGTTRYDSTSTTLVGAQTTSSTSWAITTVNSHEVWSTTAVPYDWTVSGERVTVTAMTAAAGTGPFTQTATVTRNVNSLPGGKAHVANESIQLFDSRVYAI